MEIILDDRFICNGFVDYSTVYNGKIQSKI